MKYLNVKEVSQLLGVSVPTIHRWMSDGKFPQPRRIGRTSRWSEATIHAFMSADAA